MTIPVHALRLLVTAGRLLRVAIVVAFGLPLPVAAQEVVVPVEPVASTAAAVPELLQRIVLLGASVTAGFDITEPFGGAKTSEYRLENYIEAALNGPHEPIATHANAFFFVKPTDTLRKQLTATLKAKPTLVVGLDTLFWFCYGNSPTEKERLERFEAGLRLMEEIPVPMVIGDIPDASQAVGAILSKKQMPELSTIAECNQRLQAWAAARKNVTVFPLSKVMAAAIANEELRLGSIGWEKGKSGALLQRDRLHPTPAGLAGLAIGILDTVAASIQPHVPESVLRRDPDYVQATATALGRAEAAKQAEASKRTEPATQPGAIQEATGP